MEPQNPEEMIRESMAPVRQAVIGPMLVGRELEELAETLERNYLQYLWRLSRNSVGLSYRLEERSWTRTAISFVIPVSSPL